nr:MAG TPA: helix-turn-helix domain-containing protein [Caudoviricetes sp.]
MSKAVMLSVRPKWCDKIANGEKTIEVRKTRPKLETPFKCYIYCTRDKHLAFMQNQTGTNLIACMDVDAAIPVGGAIGNGKVIGEFTCDWIQSFDSAYSAWVYAVAPSGSIMPMHETKALELCKKDGCLSDDDVLSYFGDEDWKAYFWHISDLRIYDTPRELSEFQRATDPCDSCHAEYTWECTDCKKFGGDIKHPPQSWCYVETLF